ncbi:MAG: HEAT repeat domain-containing protein [Planctomycetota bacterium]
MLKIKVSAVLLAAACLSAVCYCESLEENWELFIHYTAIGRPDLAEGYAQLILQSNPDPVELLGISEKSPEGYGLLLRVRAESKELQEVAKQLLEKIEEGRYIRRADPNIIIEEIRRLSSTVRGRITAVERLKNADEYAIPYMIEAIRDPARRAELANIVWALPQLGKGVIRPLVASLEMDNAAVKVEVVRALGKIGYPQALAYLKYLQEKDASDQVRMQAQSSIEQIDPAALKRSAAELFFDLAESYYNHHESLSPAADYDFANIWFLDRQADRIVRRKVDKAYFNELMAMRCCEWALKSDPDIGRAISLWLAAFFKSESTNMPMPDYFGQGHAPASTYATTMGPEYLHMALQRAVNDKDAYVALGVIRALSTSAGEKSLMYWLGTEQPLAEALSFPDKAVRYSAAIAIAIAGPKNEFPESKLVVSNLAESLGQDSTSEEDVALKEEYAMPAAMVMLSLAESRNSVIDLSLAEETLIKATKDKRTELCVTALQILAHMHSAEAQRAIAAAALSDKNDTDVQVSAFMSLSISGKINGNLLEEETIDQIYSLISSDSSDSNVRSAAAAAYGTLDLPSRKVRDLILDQARS